MALTSANCVAEPRAYSIGPLKQQLLTFSCVSGDTSGTITCDKLSQVLFAVVTGLTHTADPTFSSNVITLAFADPVATVKGQVIAYGR